MIKLLRIDDRLIHGQVAMAWTKSVAADHIIVVDDSSANDKMKRMILSLAKPASTGLDIVTTADFLKIFEKRKNQNLMIVTSSPKKAFEIVSVIQEKINSINIGGLRYSDGKEKVNEYVAITTEDKEYLEKLKQLGFTLIMQATPTGKSKYY
jgi:mannose/fructose/N-acetylgalactosamine-specific phosphotransferase system component IIB